MKFRRGCSKVTSYKFWHFLTPPSPSITLLCPLPRYWCHKITNPPTPSLRDVIYEWTLMGFVFSFSGYCNCDQQQTNVSNQRWQKGAQHQKQQLWRQFVKQTFEKKSVLLFPGKITSCWKNSCWEKNYYLPDHLLIVTTWEKNILCC